MVVIAVPGYECPGVRLYRHLSLKLSWAALRRIYDPSLMWRPVEILVICYLVSSGVSLGLTNMVALALTRGEDHESDQEVLAQRKCV